jgi:hypothetical protein
MKKRNSGRHKSLVHCKTGYSTVAGQGERNRRPSESRMGSTAQFGLLRVLNDLIMSSISEPISVNVIQIYYYLWLCSPVLAMASCGSAAQCWLWPPVALQPRAGYGRLWLCSPVRAMASCGSAARSEERRVGKECDGSCLCGGGGGGS